jgi:hypothetical protein
MLKSFKTKDFIVVALLAAAYIVMDLVFAAAVSSLTGIPLATAFVTGIIAGFFMLITIKLIPKFGSLTLLRTILAVLELPTSLGGAPGFWPKIIINALSGFLGDLWMKYTGYSKRWNLFIGFYIIAAVNLLTFVFFLVYMGIPNANKILGMVYYLIPTYWILGTAGILIGLGVWNKIKNKKIVLQLKG